ncbi:siderophore ABC transporter substrate-binding protein [Bacillus safensis]|uniref:siderophore ABC transporter substrate-binding protein n=1 Tax=Bacillus TaxID=1386 RepID=UPI0011A78082|nr:siderophore ABC transporter substrate-binding protein [Bacillus safensis]MCM2985731.1 siderophore ABC transporter substrate-binding protein [Bacillus safensis]MCY7446549.1 siderophore ABC transporter substrate-binding protein [Bacillus safensis]MCY7457291.1 siderophore ABC transporter substrate-binding protein [Bacillus safensis]MDP4563920.1 siderophore ABC transporter substrate-binding protein [Bacillus safensis]MEC2426993.1 siderophore ABC transporter substrate-binding protein [Bacillus s
MKKWTWMMTILIAIVVLAACGNQGKTEGTKGETVTVKDMLNKDGVKIKKNPKKVVVFDMGSLDTLDKIGVNVTALPKQAVPKYLSKYEGDKYENVGGLKEPNFEKIAEIKPDLIIIQHRQADAFDEFSNIAPTIYMDVDNANYMESFKKNAKTLGKVFDKEDKVKEELAAIDQKVDALKKEAKELKKKGLVIMANDSKMTAFGPKSRYGLIHDVFGITPADQKLEPSDKHGQSISYEYMVKTNPDYLFVVDRGAAIGEETSAKQLVENDYVKSVKAIKNNHVVYLNSDMWYLSGGGLESLSAMIGEVKQGISQK